jgi:hypothetical protein
MRSDHVETLRAVARRYAGEDGSYIGTDGNNNLIALGLDGSLVWQQAVAPGSCIAPLYATADGGAIVTSTIQCVHNVVTDTPCSPSLAPSTPSTRTAT